MRRTEERLLRRLGRGDRDAAVTLVDGHYQQVYWYLLGLCRDGERAADLTQQTFARAWQGLAGFKGAASFRTWLFSIARNEFLQELRQGHRRAEWAEFAEVEIIADPAPSAEEMVLERDATERMRQQVMGLPGPYREVISLHYYGGLSLREAASVIGAAVGTVKSRLHQALALLQERLSTQETEDENEGTAPSPALGNV